MINRERTRAAMSSSRGKLRPFIRASLDSAAMKQTSVRSSLRTRRRCLREDVHVNHVIVLHVNLNTGLIQSDPYHCPSGRRRIIKFLSQCTSTAQHVLVSEGESVDSRCHRMFQTLPDSLEPRSTVLSSGRPTAIYLMLPVSMQLPCFESWTTRLRTQ
ncbi:conserved hypothetical protein [Trichinella spiralis]|uniref:hypothetical protein n=1 Tax=Trichinella spiralis TaxID=6334 RepID=UPI0001EFD5F2|nr:conserved hypothetical protein [Trichinella spiralis]